MKRFGVSFFIFKSIVLWGHGFGVHTQVRLEGHAWQQIGTICQRILKENIAIASYDTNSLTHTTARVIRGGRSQTSSYVRFGFEERFKNSQHHNELACTPTQEFYGATMQGWIPAYMLKVGDELLCANGVKKVVAYVQLINKPIAVFTIEVEETHTFFVTHHSLLTHNMILPIAFSVGLSVPFGASAGGVAGSFFGPVSFFIGAAAGCVIGLLAKIVYEGVVPTYAMEMYNTDAFAEYIKRQPVTDVALSEPHIVLGPDYVVNQHDLSWSVIEQDISRGTAIACGDTTVLRELPILVTPIIPLDVQFKKPGCGGLSEAEKKLFSDGCMGTPILTPNKDDTIACGGIPLNPIDVSELITTVSKTEVQRKIADQSKLTSNERYNGPTHNRTEDWIKTLSEKIRNAFERTNLGMQGKRAYRLKEKVEGFTGIAQGEFVVIDALHKDHLEVYDKYGDWVHVANFDGTRNIEKTNQG